MNLKQLLLSLLLLTNVFYIKAQIAPGIQWQRCLGGSDVDDVACIHQTNDGGYIVAGSASSVDGDINTNYGSSDFWILKLNNIGAIEWQQNIGGSDGDAATDIQQTRDGGYIVSGLTYSVDGQVTGNHGQADGWVIKLGTTGIVEWKKCLGGSNTDEIRSIQQTNDGGYILGGDSRSIDGGVNANHGGIDMWIVKLGDTGNIEWQRNFGGDKTESISSIRQTYDGSYIATGYTYSVNTGDVSGYHGGYSDLWVLKISNAGNLLWQKCFGGSNEEGASSIRQTEDSGYIIGGFTRSNDGNVAGNHGKDDLWVIKIDSVGSLSWQKCFGGSQYDETYTLEEANDGGYIIAGSSNSNDGDVTGQHGNYDIWLVKLDSTGNLLWQKCLGGDFQELGFSVEETNDNGFIVAGLTRSDNGDVSGLHGIDSSNSDGWIIKLGSTPVPLTLTSFTAQKQNNSILLNWQTQTEINSKHFIIEKSNNATDFKIINTIAASGNSSITKNYFCTDAAPFNGINYYRLKQVDKDGSFVYSKTVAVNFGSKGSVLYPNPASSVITIIPSGIVKAITIITAEGKTVQQLQPVANNQYNISSLPKGMYAVKILYEQGSEVIQLNKN